jgi:nitrate reductase molybdenum cofactor assembly chaperone NarJ/NarW
VSPLLRRALSARVDATACRVTLLAASVLLAYPDDDLLGRLPLVRDALTGVPDAAAEPLLRLCEHLESTPLDRLQQDYVETFDLRRRCSPYLTYFSHGDTRKRGMALLRFTHAYRSAGAEFTGDELPDHLAVVCEFAATADLELGLRLLAENRAGVELLHRALVDARSPYAGVLDAVRAVLPDPAPRDLERALELARTGPPEEEVGLEPFGPPEQMGGRR